MDELRADVLVVGGGMGGLTVAGTAAERGATVVVLDVAPEPGGSAALSEGYVWTAPSPEVFAEQDPDGDADRFAVMLDGLPEALDWVAGLGVTTGPWLTGVLGYGEGRQIDIAHHLRRCRALVSGAGGWVLPGSEVTELLGGPGGDVYGAEVRQAATGQRMRVLAPATVLATGGFQASPSLRDERLFPGASALVPRTNPHSDGAGLRLGTAAGAATVDTPGFYGHLVPNPLDVFEPPDYARLAQYHSEHGLLLDAEGARFTDESLGDHMATQEVARRGTALLVVDERVRREQVMRPFIAGMDAVDKMAEAGRRGARYAGAPTLAGLAAAVAGWGYPEAGVRAAVESFNAGVFSVPRRNFRTPLAEPPYAAVEVRAAITFTYGGLATDDTGRVLAPSGAPVRGLYAAGVDAGGFNVRGYTGGLVRGLVLGRRTGLALTKGLDR
ncbi:MAG TPA: FAD-binding protein [Pseudonocardiaceae bacterium]